MYTGTDKPWVLATEIFGIFVVFVAVYLKFLACLFQCGFLIMWQL